MSRGPLSEPRAPVRPRRLAIHGDVRVDDYYWLRQRDDPEVRAYLECENSYTEAMMAHTEELQEQLYEEIKGRVQLEDVSVPYLLDGAWHYYRFEADGEYPIYCRRRDPAAPEEVLLDANRLARERDYLALRRPVPSPDGRYLAYAFDEVGRREFEIRIRDLEKGADLATRVPSTSGSVVWAADSRHLFYARLEPETLRSWRIQRHRLRSDLEKDDLLYEERDPTFDLGLARSKSRRFLFVVAHHTLRSEVRYLPTDEPEGDLRLFLAREGEREYEVDHLGDRFFIRTNDGGPNFRLLSTPVMDTSRTSWTEVVPHRDDVFLADFELFRDDIVLVERRGGLRRLRVVRLGDGADLCVDFDEPVYSTKLGENHDENSRTVRFVYSSLVTPESTFDLDLRSGERRLLKRQPVPGYEAERYTSERVWVVARDGARVPVSLVHRRDVELDGSAPLLLHGYGAYGFSRDPSFQSEITSLLDRGFVYAIAHVRGGQELGRAWYEAGRRGQKMNTFHDFIDVAEYLCEHRYTSSDRLYAHGASAGGLLVGVVLNLRPELFAGAVAGVPFVDVVTTMLDESLPLTTFEWDEWGDPRRLEDYEYILSYSPYDGVGEKAYPHLLVISALHDSQVQYFEPAKWVAKLRALRTGSSRLLLKTHMKAGHQGASGRFQRFRQLAFEYAFLIDLLPRA